MDTPEQTVRAFIHAYHTWNDRANDRSKSVRGNATVDQEASAEYEKLVAQLCASSVVPQGISYGDDSMHDPERETIESVAVSGREATVCTKHLGLYDFVSDYEYRLVLVDKEWRIASLRYIDEDGGYECL